MESAYVLSPFNSLQQRRETACSAPEGHGRGGRGRQGGKGEGEIKNSIFVPSTNLNSDNKKTSNFTQSKNAK